MKFYIDFGGYCEIEANDEEEARLKFWDFIVEDKPLPCNYYELHTIEEKRD